jgi:uncharacterized protein YwqG
MNKTTTAQVNFRQLHQFVEYVLSFYGKQEDALYDYEFTEDEVLNATIEYISAGKPFEGDSVDREAVRDIVFTNREEN